MRVQCCIVGTHCNECTVRTDNTTLYTHSEDSYFNLSSRIKLIDLCVSVQYGLDHLFKYENSSKLVDNPVIHILAIAGIIRERK